VYADISLPAAAPQDFPYASMHLLFAKSLIS